MCVYILLRKTRIIFITKFQMKTLFFFCMYNNRWQSGTWSFSWKKKKNSACSKFLTIKIIISFLLKELGGKVYAHIYSLNTKYQKYCNFVTLFGLFYGGNQDWNLTLSLVVTIDEKKNYKKKMNQSLCFENVCFKCW